LEKSIARLVVVLELRGKKKSPADIIGGAGKARCSKERSMAQVGRPAAAGVVVPVMVRQEHLF
jgi:hypothetical protein